MGASTHSTVYPARLRTWGAEVVARGRDHKIAAAAVLSALVATGLVAQELTLRGADMGDWDLLFLSGCLTVIAGLWLARGESGRLAAVIGRLANRGALAGPEGHVTPADVDRLMKAIDQRAKRWARRCGLVIALLIAASFITVGAMRNENFAPLDAIGGPLVGALGGLLVGRVLGSMLAYGFIARSMDAAKLTLNAVPGHVDGAAGLKPLGDFYLRQALLLALPAAFLLAWSLILLIPSWDERYSGWREWYLGLLVIAIGLEIAAFVAPLWRVHRTMQDQKREALVKADSLLAPRIEKAREELEQDLDNERRAAVRDQLEQLTASYRAREEMPTWPVDSTVRRRLTLGNLALIVPLVSQIAALSGR
jgi:hypothetical protein